MIMNVLLLPVLCPLLGSLIAGFFGKIIGKSNTHRVTIGLMVVAFLSALWILEKTTGVHVIKLYTWAVSGWPQAHGFHFDIALRSDRLTNIMMVIVTFVSLLVHIYTVGYMRDDQGYQRFFSYVSLFTVMMLLLVLSNNFMQLFLGWEGVGLVSYLLIGFWFTKNSAARGGLKAFIVNRIGDVGLLLAIAAIIDHAHSLNYQDVFASWHSIALQKIQIFSGVYWHLDTVICILLFIGAMGKSAQVPLHVWLPASMEGPTPISALIHAATMVTAGVFMVARLWPLFNACVPALSVILIIGSTGALFLGLLAFVEFDIKRVIAYSTMSQLGYMMAANGAQVYSLGIFHLATHACFKALLFLCAGSVIVALHHQQDMRKMGGLKKSLPITYVCFLIGACALAAIPPFSGFYSKDLIIEAVKHSSIPGSGYAYVCLLLGTFVTSFYIFRAFFMTFHGESRVELDSKHPIKEYAVMWWPLILLAIPSVFLGLPLVHSVVNGDASWLGSVITNHPHSLADIRSHFHGAFSFAIHGVMSLPFMLSVLGVFCAWLVTLSRFESIKKIGALCAWPRRVLQNEYGFDVFYKKVFVNGVKKLSEWLYVYSDKKIIDEGLVNNSGRSIRWVSKYVRLLQTGFLNHYIFIMIAGLLAFLLLIVGLRIG
jgi:NADH-quinone oxidoreductase subunit L